MQYRQQAKLKSNQKKYTPSSGLEVQQIVFDKEITQSWKVDTDDPTEILPYCLDKLCKLRKCEFWHQLKFFYFQNYQQASTMNSEKKSVKMSSEQIIQTYSSVQIVYTSQRLEECKRLIKSVWKITRLRLLSSFNEIKRQAGIEDEQSLQLQDQKLNSYMRFLKLQQNKRIDLAIQTFESVVQKNTRRKLLNAFLNMREMLKDQKKKQLYQDKIRVGCFIQIVIRNIKKLNSEIVSDCFAQLYQLSQTLKREEEYNQLQIRRKRQTQQRKLLKSKELQKNTNYEHYKSVSSKKVIVNDEDNQSEHIIEKLDTVNRYSSRNKNVNQKQTSLKQNHISTVKRQNQLQRQKQALNQSMNKSMTSEYYSNIKSNNNEKIIHSQYYYDQNGGGQHNDDEEEQELDQHGVDHQNHRFNMNALPTRRSTHLTKYSDVSHNQYAINGIENNVYSSTLHKKTARTPSRSEVNKKSILSNDAQYQTKYQMQKNDESHHHRHHEERHIPITQRIEKHYREEHYEEEQEEQESSHHDQSGSSQKIYQQICVIRNFATTPARKPDRYEKIPVISNNIEFRQFFMNSKQKRVSRNIEIHSNSYYDKKVCQNCHYCLKLKEVQELVQKYSNQQKVINKKNSATERAHIVTITSSSAIQTKIQNQALSNNSPKLDLTGIQKIIKQNNEHNQFQPIKLDMNKLSQNDERNQVKTVVESTIYTKRQNLIVQKPKLERKSNSPKSPSYKPYTNTLATPLSQVSAFTEGSQSKTLSERKIFKRKPMQ